MSNITTQINNTLGTTASTTNTGSTSSTSNSSASSFAATEQQFLTMFLTQLKNQDPSKPMDSSQFLQNIGTMTSVEQAIQTNTKLDKLISLQGSQIGSPVSYIDKSIDFQSSQIQLTNHLAHFSYTLDSTNPPSTVNMLIKDASGNVVVNVKGTNKAGLNSVAWDGTDANGNQASDGVYTVTVQYPDPTTANSANPTSITVPTFTTGTVTGADFTGANPMLEIGGISIPLSAVMALHGTTASAGT